MDTTDALTQLAGHTSGGTVHYLAHELLEQDDAPDKVRDLAFQLRNRKSPTGLALAQHLLSMLADSGDAQAHVDLGLEALLGDAQQAEIANNHFETALALSAEPSEARITALVSLADSLRVGRGCEKDPQRALSLYEEAAQLGVVSAAYQAATLWDTCLGEERDNLPGPDFEKAAAYYERAAEHGIIMAMTRLGVMHMQRSHPTPNRDVGLKYLLRAARAEEPLARTMLGTLLTPKELADLRSGEF